MGFYRNVKNARLINEEVTHFVAENNGYYAILRRGERLDITRVFHLQPPIENLEDYRACMFAETAQGFYLFTQRIVENKPQPWEALLRLEAVEPRLFYGQAQELWRRIRKKVD